MSSPLSATTEREPRRGRSAAGVERIAQACHEGYACLVTNAAESLLEQAMMLPVEDRAQLASGLLASLDGDDVDPAEVERLWSTETARRAAELASGDAQPVNWDHVLASIDERRA